MSRLSAKLRQLRSEGRLPLDRLAQWRDTIALVRGLYHKEFGCYPRLLRPRSYTEKIQWRKLFDLDPMHAIFSDKLAVRDFIAARVGSSRLMQILWTGDNPDLIPFDALRPPYIIKSTHGSSQYIRVPHGTELDRDAIVAKCREWLMGPYGLELGEPGYQFVPRRLVIERMLTDADGGPPTELRAFVFGGKVKVVQTIFVRDGKVVSGAFHDLDWQRLRWVLLSPLHPGEFPRPAHLDELIDLAERIARGFDHLRVDFFDCDDGLRIGEITLYSWSGLIPFKPPQADLELGSHWHIRAPAWRAIKALALQRREIYPPPRFPRSDAPIAAWSKGVQTR